LAKGVTKVVVVPSCEGFLGCASFACQLWTRAWDFRSSANMTKMFCK